MEERFDIFEKKYVGERCSADLVALSQEEWEKVIIWLCEADGHRYGCCMNNGPCSKYTEQSKAADDFCFDCAYQVYIDTEEDFSGSDFNSSGSADYV